MVRDHRNSKIVVLAAGISALALTLTACGSSTDNADSTTTASDAPAEEEVVDGVPATLVGMHIEGAEGGAWAAAPFGALRMWDNGTAWSQIEIAKDEFKWGNIDGLIENTASKGMTDIMMVLGTTPEWAAKEINDSLWHLPCMPRSRNLNALNFGTEIVGHPRQDALHMDTNVLDKSHLAAGFSGHLPHFIAISFAFLVCC